MKKIIICYLFSISSVLAQNIETIFNDTLQPGWRFGQWSQDNEPSYLIQDNVVFSGDKAVCFDYSIIGSGFSGIGFERHIYQNWSPARMYQNQFIIFHFYFNPGDSVEHIGAITMTLDNGSSSVSLTDYLPPISIG